MNIVLQSQNSIQEFSTYDGMTDMSFFWRALQKSPMFNIYFLRTLGHHFFWICDVTYQNLPISYAFSIDHDITLRRRLH